MTKYDHDVLPCQVKDQGNVLECIYIFVWVICIASQVLFDLSWRTAYGSGLVQILQFQLGDILKLASVEGVLPDMGAHLDMRKEHQATWEPWEVSFHRGLPSLSYLCLTPFA